MWVHNDDPLECGVRLPIHVINAWKRPRVIADWHTGATLRELADRYEISHQTAKEWTDGETRTQGAARRPHGGSHATRG